MEKLEIERFNKIQGFFDKLHENKLKQVELAKEENETLKDLMLEVGSWKNEILDKLKMGGLNDRGTKGVDSMDAGRDKQN